MGSDRQENMFEKGCERNYFVHINPLVLDTKHNPYFKY